MRTAVFSDIHGDLCALQEVLADIDRVGCDRLLCLGDVVDGAGEDAACIEKLVARGILTVRGNHDEWYLHDRRNEAAEWLASLPEQIVERDVIYTHISPRGDDVAVKNRFVAWNVLDETAYRLAFVGHAHIPLLCGLCGSVPGAAKVHPFEYGIPLRLDPADRYIVCPGSIALPRDELAAARYVVYDDREQTVEFRCAGAVVQGADVSI